VYKHILIATDGSDLAQKAVQQGLGLARHLKAAVTAITVTAPWPVAESGALMTTLPLQDYQKLVTQHAEDVLAPVRDLAGKLGVACDTVHVSDEYPAEGIIEHAKAKSCDLIVMASHGRRGLAKMLLGSQATRVLAYSQVPVLICK
jgi:nucleotide-binding universal stress UspA family protein